MADLVISPMPDELAIAHLERIRRLMCIQSKLTFEYWLKQWVSKECGMGSAPSRLVQLAALSSMSSVDYAHRHSMLGILRFVAKAKDVGLHGAADGERFSNRIGMSAQKKHASFCPRCAEEDAKEHGFSWFRRSHQLLGLDWCPHHWVRLKQVPSREPWVRTPLEWMNNEELQASNENEQAIEPTEFEICFSRLAVFALNQKGPIEHQDISVAIGKRARELDLRLSAKGVRPTISDRVKKIAPHSWLVKICAEYAQNGDGQILRAVNKLANGSTPQAGLTYMTSLACLWPGNPNGAISCLRQLEVADKPVTRQKRLVYVTRRPEFWHGEIWPVYVASKGRIGNVATALGQGQKQLALKMHQAGLPNMRSINSPKWRAFIRFSEGESLHEACSAERVDPALVQALLRECCGRISAVAKQLTSTNDLKAIAKLPVTPTNSNSLERLQLVEPANEAWERNPYGKKLPPT